MKGLRLLRYLLLSLIALPIWLSHAIAGDACHERRLKIIAIGDSITQGGSLTGEYTYRLPLSRMLETANYKFDFIGRKDAGLDPDFKWPADFDDDHQGFYGATTSFVERSLRIALPKLPAPDFALIHLGSNDLNYNNVGESIITPLKSIISQLRSRNPKIRILISELQLKGFLATYIRFHLKFMAMREDSTLSPVITVPHYIGWKAKDTFDGIHPSPTGQKRMAREWFDAIDLLCNPTK